MGTDFAFDVRYCGIDPGLKGGIALVSSSGSLIDAVPMPNDVNGIDVRAVMEKIRRYTAESFVKVIIEKTQSMPKQGISSAHTYGIGFGSIIGVLVALDIPYMMVRPAQWTKAMHVGTDAGEPKERSYQAAVRTWPRQSWQSTPRCRKPHDGMIDAALIAEFGRRTWHGVGSAA